MPTIRFVKQLPPVQVEEGDLLMQCLLGAGLPVASSCHGDGVCGKCRVTVVAGLKNLSRIGTVEQLLHERLQIPAGVRISCQTQVFGDVTVDTSYW